MHYVQTEDPFSDDTLNAMRAYAKNEENKGNRPYLIHLGTFSGPLAAVGYIAGAQELFKQTDDSGFNPAAIYAPVGSGGTHAGLLAGARLLGKKSVIIGISVNVDAEVLSRNIKEMVAQAIKLIDPHQKYTALDIPLSDVNITDNYVNPGYGKVNKEGAEAIRIMADTEGLLFDPVYTGKALAALIDDVRKGVYTKNDNIVFLYTGGVPNLFTHGHELMEIINKK